MREMATCRVPMARVLSSNQRRIRRFPIHPFDPTSERLQPIQSSRTEYDFRAALSEHNRSGFTYAAARPGYDDDLAFNSVYEVFHFQYLIYFDLLGSQPMILVRPTRCQDWLRIVQALALRPRAQCDLRNSS